jgi:peptidoglycan/xylan/chitin deacetylase (PgdA/CDA1 family)
LVLAVAAALTTGCFGGATAPRTASIGISTTQLPTASPAATTTPTTTGQSSAIATPSTGPATPGPTPAFVTYTVVAGDSLSHIAGRYGTTWQSLIYWNRDRYPSLDPAAAAYNPNWIQAGWQLLVRPGVVVAYEVPPPPATPVPTTPPVAPASPSVAVFHGNRSSAMVALTFDMGGRTDPSVQIMTWLRDHGVPATVFMTGSILETAAGREVMSIINARPDLFDLGNHSYSHPDLTTMSASQVADELRRAEAAIDRYADQTPRPLFRPPNGAWNAAVLAGAGSVGYRWSVLWDVDTIDWKPISEGGPTAQRIVADVLAKARGGSIVLMHLGGYETLKALPDVVAGLRGQGYSLVTLNRLIGS